MDGLFITFEGPDGAGKSTQIQMLADYLQEKTIPYVLTHEPGGTLISDDIRRILLAPDYHAMKHQTEILLYAASRAQHVREVIEPALKAGKVVLCDRFVDASVAYQGYGLDQDIESVKAINDYATGSLVPNRTYLIDVSPEAGHHRLVIRQEDKNTSLDRIEQKQISYHEKVRDGFQTLKFQHSERIYALNGEMSRQAVHEEVTHDFDNIWAQHNMMK